MISLLLLLSANPTLTSTLTMHVFVCFLNKLLNCVAFHFALVNDLERGNTKASAGVVNNVLKQLRVNQPLHCFSGVLRMADLI